MNLKKDNLTWVTMVEASKETGLRYDRIREYRLHGLIRGQTEGRRVRVALEDVQEIQKHLRNIGKTRS